MQPVKIVTYYVTTMLTCKSYADRISALLKPSMK